MRRTTCCAAFPRVILADNWKILESDLRGQILQNNASLLEITQYGQLFEIKGELCGLNKVILSVCTRWMIEPETRKTKFMTMYSDK